MKNILLAVDGSDHAEAAARFFSSLPHNDKLDVTVLTVVQPPRVGHSNPTADPIAELYEREKSAAREIYKTIEHMFAGANATVRHEIRKGHLGQTIVETAKELAAELVVTGACGRSNISRVLLGSTSDYVATHSPCSVLVVRTDTLEATDRPLRIALGYEETGAAQAALEELSEIGWGRGAHIDVVSVAPYWYGFVGEIGPEIELEMGMKPAVNSAAEQLHDVATIVTPHTIPSEHTGEGLVKFVTKHRSDLLVVGETQRSFLGRVLMGNVSRFVLRHAPCSVWITRNRMIHGVEKPKKVTQRATG